jgi:hypothetical protein
LKLRCGLAFFGGRLFPCNESGCPGLKETENMKILLLICAVAGVAAAATYLVVSSQMSASFNRERAFLRSSWEEERAELEAALRSRQRSGPPASAGQGAADRAPGRAPAQAVLDKLKIMKVLPGSDRNTSIRHVIHQLQNLVDLGTDALPPIRAFLAKFEDVDYGPPEKEDAHEPVRREGGDSMDRMTGFAPSQPATEPRLDSVLPASLRLGLVDVLREIGGEGAEEVLAEMLSTSGRGIEVAYVARTLQEMVPGKYRDLAVAAAKDLLANPPAIDNPSRLDAGSRNHLYGLLSMYNDRTFVDVAEGHLVTEDGRIDRTTLNYLTSTLKEESVPVLYEAFNDQRMTNLWERASLTSQIINYAGVNQQANDIFKDLVGNENLPSWLRATAIQGLAGGRTQASGGTLSDHSQIKARIALLNSLPEIQDERLNRIRYETIAKLSERLQTTPEAEAQSFRKRLDRTQGDPEMPPLPVAD